MTLLSDSEHKHPLQRGAVELTGFDSVQVLRVSWWVDFPLVKSGGQAMDGGLY